METFTAKSVLGFDINLYSDDGINYHSGYISQQSTGKHYSVRELINEGALTEEQGSILFKEFQEYFKQSNISPFKAP